MGAAADERPDLETIRLRRAGGQLAEENGVLVRNVLLLPQDSASHLADSTHQFVLRGQCEFAVIS